MERVSVAGVWGLSSIEISFPSGEKIFPLGRSPKGLLIYMENGYMSGIMSSDNRPSVSSAALAGLTEAELVSIGKGFNAYVGRYWQDHKYIRHSVEVSYLPNLMRKKNHLVKYTINDDRLLLQSNIPGNAGSDQGLLSISWEWKEKTTGDS